jgi:serine/threonine-protein kinase
MPLVTRRADVRATQAPAAKDHSVSRRWAWLALPLVALVAWGAFALGGLVNGGAPPTSTGGSVSSHPAATTATEPTQPTQPTTTSASATAATTTTKTEPTTSATTSTSQEPTHPGKGKGRGRGK